MKFSKNKKIYNSVVRKLKKVIGQNIKIDHVGSTAIPNMFGKNIIDILIGAKEKVEFEKISKKLVDMAFFASKVQGDIYQFFASSKDETKSGDIHIHLVILDNEKYREFLVLKNYLLNNKDESLAYSNFKKDIEKRTTDRSEYKKIKSEYVTKLLDNAKKF